MKRKYLLSLIMALCAGVCLVACGGSKNETVSTSSSSSSEAVESTDSSSSDADKVADSSDKVEEEEVGWEGMTAIPAADVKDGEYSITVDSSSSMFNITECTILAQNGEMTARMTMGGTGYLYLYMGTGDEAASADEAEYIPFEENGDVHIFSVPVSALDEKIAVSAFSKKKEKWYDRTLVFNAAGVAKADGLSAGGYETAQSLGLSDGTYSCDATLIGGTGRASIESCEISVSGGEMTAKIEWSSDKYDYMIIDDEKYNPVNTEGNSVFEIPIVGLGYPTTVIADTTAMGTPHEISYRIMFDKDSLQ